MALGNTLLFARLQQAAEIIADDARKRAALWSRRMPLSVRIRGGSTRVTITGGGTRAPQYYTFEGKPSGAPRSHPVWGHGPRETWHWVAQDPRPTLAVAAESKADEAAAKFAEIVDDWTRQLGYR